MLLYMPSIMETAVEAELRSSSEEPESVGSKSSLHEDIARHARIDDIMFLYLITVRN